MENWAKYIGVAGTMALLITIAMILWVTMKIDVPDIVYGFEGAVIGYYFGTNGHVIKTELDERTTHVT